MINRKEGGRPAVGGGRRSFPGKLDRAALMGGVCGFLAALSVASPALAADYAPPKRSGSPEIGMEEVQPPPGGAPIELVTSHGRLLRFDCALDAVFIADPSIADIKVVAPDVVYVFGRRAGATNIIAIAAATQKSAPGGPKLKAALPLRVIADDYPVNEAKQTMQPTTSVDIAIFGRRAAAVGHTRTIDEALDVAAITQSFSPPGQPPINNTTIAGSQQVNIRVRFAEVSRAELRSFGISWHLFGTGGIYFSSFNVGVFIEALERAGALTVLAEPNLSTVTGQTASFLAGGEVPLPVPQAQNLVTLQYKPFGVSLVFTPTLIKKDRISLHVKPEVSLVSPVNGVKMNGVEAPSFTVRRAETTVEMASGQTFAIGGLFQRQMTMDIETMPVLGGLPVIGALFHSERFRRDETELVILITPYLVNPVRDRNMATPLDSPRSTVSDDKYMGQKSGGKSRKADQQSGLVFK